MSLRKKEIDILEILLKEAFTITELAIKFNTSERNIRYIVDNINFYLLKILKVEIEKQNKKIKVNLLEGQLEYFLKIVYSEYYILEKEEREKFILIMFLFIENIKLKDIEIQLDITRATLKKDMFQISQELKNSDLKFIFYKNRFFIDGNEKKLRHFKTLKILQCFDILEDKFIFKDSLVEKIFKNSGVLEKLNEFGKLSEVSNIVDTVEKDFDITFSKEFKKLIIIFILVSLERVSREKIINKKFNYEFLIETKQYKIVEKRMEKLIPKNLKYELVHMTEYFISGGVNENLEELKNSIELFIEKLIEYLQEKIQKKIGSKSLNNRLMNYLIPAIYRLRNNFSLGEVGEKKEIYFFIEEFCKNENYLFEKLTENEIYFIAEVIQGELDDSSKKLINLEDIISIVEKNSVSLDKENFIKDILEKYSFLIKVE